jgi:hypothetical protein
LSRVSWQRPFGRINVRSWHLADQPEKAALRQLLTQSGRFSHISWNPQVWWVYRTDPSTGADVAAKAAVNPNCDSTVFEINLKECGATLP